MRQTLTKALKRQIRLKLELTKLRRKRELREAYLARYEKVCLELEAVAKKSIEHIGEMSTKEIGAALKAYRAKNYQPKGTKRHREVQERIVRTLKAMRAKGISHFTIRDVIDQNPALKMVTVRELIARLVKCKALEIVTYGRGQGRQTIYAFPREKKNAAAASEVSCSS